MGKAELEMSSQPGGRHHPQGEQGVWRGWGASLAQQTRCHGAVRDRQDKWQRKDGPHHRTPSLSTDQVLVAPAGGAVGGRWGEAFMDHLCVVSFSTNSHLSTGDPAPPTNPPITNTTHCITTLWPRQWGRERPTTELPDQAFPVRSGEAMWVHQSQSEHYHFKCQLHTYQHCLLE